MKEVNEEQKIPEEKRAEIIERMLTMEPFIEHIKHCPQCQKHIQFELRQLLKEYEQCLGIESKANLKRR